MTQSVLILGGRGRFGRNAAEAFWNAGWRVQLFDRAHDDLIEAAQDADVIVHGWNPAYTDWAKDLPGLTEQVIAAAKASGATVLIPGNVYVYGTDAPDLFGSDTPHMARNPMGRLRIDMEETFRQSGVPTIILRAGDFLDTQASGNWFDMIMAPSLAKGVLRYPGNPNVPHAWAYLPDVARASVALANKRADLPAFFDVAFPGYTLTGNEMAALSGLAIGKPVRVKRMSWLPLRLASPVWKMARHLLEMRYLWNKPHQMDPSAFDAALPDFIATPPDEALARAIQPVLAAKPDQPKSGDAVHRAVPAE